MTPVTEFADVDVLNEEIIIHPTAKKRSRNWIVEFRVLGKVIIDGKEYEFERVIEAAVKKAEQR